MIDHKTQNEYTSSRSRRHGEKKPKSSAGRPLLRLPAPTPEEIREARLKANLSQGQACKLVGISEVMTWSNYERRAANGDPKGKIDPMRWAAFLVLTGQHPGFVLIPRLGVELPKSTTAMRRRGPAIPEQDVTFVVEHLKRGLWEPVEGKPFSTLTAACSAIDAMEECLNIKKKRIKRYLNGEPDQVVSHPSKRHKHLQHRSAARAYPSSLPFRRRQSPKNGP